MRKTNGKKHLTMDQRKGLNLLTKILIKNRKPSAPPVEDVKNGE